MNMTRTRYRALSLWQPWATLVALGLKQYETRSWATDYRGPVIIHAAKFRGEIDWFYVPEFETALRAAGIDHPSRLPLGVGLCKADLVQICRTEDIRDELGERERAFGNYGDRRFAWQFDHIEIFPKPIPARGAQGLWLWRIPL